MVSRRARSRPGDTAAVRVTILFNPVSGQGRAFAEAERHALAIEAAGHRVVMVPSRREPPRAWLDPALAGVDALLVAGGDGAIRLAAGSAARAGVPIHHLPLGTENLFARQFGGSRAPEQAVAALARGEVRPVDLGRIRVGAVDEEFTIMASLGIDAAIVHDLASRRTGAISHLSYVGPAVRQGLAWEPPEISVAVDDGAMKGLGRGILVVANASKYALGIDPVPEADPADGRLDAAFLPCEGPVEAMVGAIRMVAGGDHPGVMRMRGRVVRVRSRPAAPWQVDGDAVPAAGSSEAVLEVSPEPLGILVPGV